MELQSSHIIYDGLTHNTDCLSVCQYNTDLNSVLEDILDFVDTCGLTIPTCFTDDAVVPVSVIDTPTLNNVLQALLNQACAGQVRVSSQDLCLGQLIDKISSEDGSVAISYPIDGNGCQSLDLSVTPSSANNSIVEISDLDPHALTINGDLYNLSLPIGILPTNGSALNIMLTITKSVDTITPTVNIVIGSTSLGLLMNTSGNGTLFVYNFRLVRTSSTTVILTGTYSFNSLIAFGYYTEINRIFSQSTSITVNNLDSNDLILTVPAVIASGTVTGTSLFIDKFNK